MNAPFRDHRLIDGKAVQERILSDVRAQVALSLFSDFENYTTFKPAAYHEKSLAQVFDQVIAWGGALKALREKSV